MLTRVIFRSVLFVSVLCLAPSSVLAWNDRGHMLSAMIAYSELTPAAKEKIDSVLLQHPQYQMLLEGGPAEEGDQRQMWVFAKAATWPDLVRSNNNPLHGTDHHSRWHYVDFPYALDDKKRPEPMETWDGHSDPDNLIQAMSKVKNDLEAATVQEDKRAISICWAEHLVGDIHQPLHACSMYSAEYPNGDQGGNAFGVSRGNSPTNLHSYWDNILGKGIVLSTLKEQIDGFLKDPELAKDKLMSGQAKSDVTAWAKESRELAEKDAYLSGKLKGKPGAKGNKPGNDAPKLPSDYEENSKKIAAKRVVLSGYRLAELLNGIFDAPLPMTTSEKK